ncbi:MGT family glycosyltransferase [Paenibacillus cellulosilyticus]|uniref:MGT family glycosyltransferase n=1 Tax=Paenibacillus cellulosilyticus TaxID=375489 RepID=A0A2V2YXL8_9BACL|nr:macrolide family glycosyltransferase [Paenibacillus cellulosilyticus]PWW02910.1 MGT family glycosyltransferase [Paenibacillus cellulosilyticus]QKS45819.1 glycosyltransferase [Paenibacillus cellulosilyticus]
MARILFINAGSEGHINPTIAVVQELIARGEEVMYFCIEAYRERLEQTGAVVRTFDDQQFIRAFISGGRTYPLERVNGLLMTADIVIPSVLEQIEGEQFDYVIHDSMFGCGRILAQILQLPAISSCTSFAQSEADFNNLLDKSWINAPEEVINPIKEKCKSLTTAIMERYGVEINSPYEVFCNPASQTIVYTTREFQPRGETFDTSYRFVGPSIAARTAQDSFDLSVIEEKSLIYISLGTVFNMANDFYRLCFEALGSSEHRVVMSVGSRTQIADLGDIPSNFIVRKYVPQTQVLQQAKLFITHGGMNSTHEGLYYEVPLIVIPQAADQPIIAGQVASIGAGIKLQMQGLTVDQLRDAVDQVLGHASYKEAAKKMSESLHQAGGFKHAVDSIIAYISGHRN